METSEKGVIRRFYEIVGTGRPEDLDEVCSPELVGHAGAGSNLAELKAAIGSFLAPFPDLTADRPVPGAGGRPHQLLDQLHGHPRGRLRRCAGQRPACEVRRVGPVPGP